MQLGCELTLTFNIAHAQVEEADVSRQLEALDSGAAALHQQKEQAQEDIDAHLALTLSVQQAKQVKSLPISSQYFGTWIDRHFQKAMFSCMHRPRHGMSGPAPIMPWRHFK